jgi:hypothetical protein
VRDEDLHERDSRIGVRLASRSWRSTANKGLINLCVKARKCSGSSRATLRSKPRSHWVHSVAATGAFRAVSLGGQCVGICCSPAHTSKRIANGKEKTIPLYNESVPLRGVSTFSRCLNGRFCTNSKSYSVGEKTPDLATIIAPFFCIFMPATGLEVTGAHSR